MNKKKLLTGTITAVALSTLLVGGVTVFAANNTDAGASEEVYEEEYNNLDNEAFDLEIKAGWYGDLNKDEVNRLYDIYDRMDAIFDEVYGEDEE